MATPVTLPQLDETVVATQRYLGALTKLRDDQVRQPSVLPGWDRGHVLAHIARNADALTQVLRRVQNGEQTSMYSSQEVRDAEIERTASLDLAAHIDDARLSAAAFEEAAGALDPERLEGTFTRTPGATPPLPVSGVGVMRRTEVEVHHADLDIGYTPADWPVDFTLALIRRRQDELAEIDGGGPSMVLSSTDGDGLWKLGAGEGPEIHGTAADLAWWLIGRGDGTGLTSSAGRLPTLGRWR